MNTGNINYEYLPQTFSTNHITNYQIHNSTGVEFHCKFFLNLI